MDISLLNCGDFRQRDAWITGLSNEWWGTDTLTVTGRIDLTIHHLECYTTQYFLDSPFLHWFRNAKMPEFFVRSFSARAKWMCTCKSQSFCGSSQKSPWLMRTNDPNSCTFSFPTGAFKRHLGSTRCTVCQSSYIATTLTGSLYFWRYNHDPTTHTICVLTGTF